MGVEPDDVLVELEDEPGCYIFWCPACVCAHRLDQRWTVTGDAKSPTVHASLRTRGPKKGDGANEEVLCHLLIQNGCIHYLADCTHAMAGKTVPMEPFP